MSTLDQILSELSPEEKTVILSQPYDIFNSLKEPAEEEDCFGKAYFEGHPACDGDPSNPSDTPCLLSNVCKQQTEKFLVKALKKTNRDKKQKQITDKKTMSDENPESTETTQTEEQSEQAQAKKETRGSKLLAADFISKLQETLNEDQKSRVHFEVKDNVLARIHPVVDGKKKRSCGYFYMTKNQTVKMIWKTEFEGSIFVEKYKEYHNVRQDGEKKSWPGYKEVIAMFPKLLEGLGN